MTSAMLLRTGSSCAENPALFINAEVCLAYNHGFIISVASLYSFACLVKFSERNRQIVLVFNTSQSFLSWRPGGRLNKKDGLSRYGDSHVKDKTS